MAIIGTIMVFLLGIWVLVVGTFGVLASAVFSGKGLWFMLVPVCVGGYIIYLACKYSPFSILVA